VRTLGLLTRRVLVVSLEVFTNFGS